MFSRIWNHSRGRLTHSWKSISHRSHVTIVYPILNPYLYLSPIHCHTVIISVWLINSSSQCNYASFRTNYNIANQPDSLGLLDAKSPEDYNSIGELRVAVYPFVQHVRKLKLGSLVPAGQNAVYNIEIETGDREHAGTDATIKIRITGIYDNGSAWDWRLVGITMHNPLPYACPSKDVNSLFQTIFDLDVFW